MIHVRKALVALLDSKLWNTMVQLSVFPYLGLEAYRRLDISGSDAYHPLSCFIKRDYSLAILPFQLVGKLAALTHTTYNECITSPFVSYSNTFLLFLIENQFDFNRFFLSIHVSQSLSGISLFLSYSLLVSSPQSFQQTHILQITYSHGSQFYLINLHWICWCLPVVKKIDSAWSIYLLFSESVCLYLVDVFKYKKPSEDHDSFQFCLRQNKIF